MNFHILTLFPDMVEQGLSASIIGRAKEKGLLSVETVNIRDYTADKHKKVDDYPYGGGAGMLMQAQPVYDAWKSVADRIGSKPRTVYLTPQGAAFTQPMAKKLAKERDLVFLCGHYEGIDERVLEEIVTDYVSIGDYVLTGGELPAMVMVDAISRMVPGVLANDESGSTESFEGNLLEYPQYSRPEKWMGRTVPEILLSGNQKKINAWRLEEAVKRTRERRPDMYLRYERLQQCREILRRQKLLHIDMTELIDRGQAELIFAEGENICLRDMASGIYFHTASDPQNGRRLLEMIKVHAKGAAELLVLHQEFMREAAKECLQMDFLIACFQAVYTRKEKLPVTGLYSVDSPKQEERVRMQEFVAERPKKEERVRMQKLGMEHLDLVLQNYSRVGDPDYIRDRIAKGTMYGAFLGKTLTGFVGKHTEGCIGLLEG